MRTNLSLLFLEASKSGCGAWTPGLLWLHNLADLFIWLAYLTIPVVLAFFARRRPDVPFLRVFWMFGAFIVLCGLTHLCEVILTWYPIVALTGWVKAATALISMATVAALIPIVPRALALRSPRELEAVNRLLEAEVAQRRNVQKELELLNRELEQRVEERTGELRKTRDDLLQAQKMEAIGRLAGGVAHDFNNLLAVIGGYGDLALRADPNDPKVHEYLGQIRYAGEQAAALTQQLLAFSRRQVLRPRTIDLNRVVRDLQRMLRPLVGDDVRLEFKLAEGLRPVRVDPVQMEQVILNLAANAKDAMPEGGAITIETESAAAGEAGGETPPGVAEYVRLTVRDTGRGMDEETLSHCFEPFFTTKDKAKATGLGLSSIYGIVNQSGGFVRVSSRPGEGTTFRIHLPAATPDPSTEGPERLAEAPSPGKGLILVAEDNPMVRSYVRTVLAGSGYTVIEAADGRTALEAARAKGGDLRLVVSDVVMPSLNGPSLAHALRAEHPDLPVVFMSGYSEEAVARQGNLGPRARLLGKPFTPQALLDAVRDALADVGAGPPRA